MRAYRDDLADIELESLLEEALDNGVRFKPKNIIELSYDILDQELLVRLISTSKPRFLQKHADELAPFWQPVELEYHEEEFEHEAWDSLNGIYQVNIPEDD